MDCIPEHLWIPLKDIEVHELLGEGSFGAVFKGIWNGRGGGTLVAIKKVRAEERETIDSLCKELNVMSSLRFQNICQVHGGCVVSDMEVWLVLEYVEGGNLHDFLISSSSPLPYSLQISLSLQAAKALNYLHSGPAPLLHRDIKSLNFLMNTNSEKLLLTDFGLSQVKDTIPKNCTTIGTLRWAAPEVLEDLPHWSEKADIFGLGMVFYEIVSQDIPYKNEKSFFSIEKKIRENIRPAIPDDCPQAFADIIRRCWDPVPNRRPSAHELICLLRNLLDPPRFSAAVPSTKCDETTNSNKIIEIGTRRNTVVRSRAGSIIAMHRGARSEEVHTDIVKSRPRSTICVSESGLQHSRELEYSSLHWTVESNNEIEVREVIKNGANIEAKDIWGRTPLHLAASIGNTSVVIVLIEYGSDLESVTKLGETPLHVASLYGNLRTIRELVHRGANMEAVAKDGFTPLSKAVSLGNLKSARELLKLGAKQGKTKGETLFQLAAKNGHTDEILIELAKWRRNINEVDERGETALHKAADIGRIKTVTELIKLGANLDAVDQKGETAIYKAAKRGHGEIIKELEEKGAKVKIMFQMALASGSVEAMINFLEFGKVNLEDRDKKGNTYLHLASMSGYTEMVKIFLQKGIKVQEENNEGHTAWQLAKERGHKEIENILEEASAACLVQ